MFLFVRLFYFHLVGLDGLGFVFFDMTCFGLVMNGEFDLVDGLEWFVGIGFFVRRVGKENRLGIGEEGELRDFEGVGDSQVGRGGEGEAEELVVREPVPLVEEHHHS